MEKLKNCPLCGGETILCQMQSGFSLMPQFSIICLKCGVEFKMRYELNANGAQYIIDPAKAAREIIEKFNRREGEHNNELE